MTSRRRFLAAAGVAAFAGCGYGEDGGSGGGAGDDTEPGDVDAGAGESDGTDAEQPAESPPDGTDSESAFSLTTSAFEDGEEIPTEYTGEGEDRSPPLTVESVPDGAETLALIVDDPDAPNGPFVHWLLWNVPADTNEIPEAIPQDETVSALDGARQGTNDFGEIGYRGPLPPEGDGPHRYRFTAYAVETTLDLDAGAEREALEDALDGATIATDALAGTYER